ncbi:MAG TPA: sulfite exporter TauE/SafE family protein [Actinomycetes bacterium]|nr:sulfite exporter TauE/SafE family protein [Actinomycetes bacterium]
MNVGLVIAAVGGGFAAGTMNAVVGAGSLVSFPALLAAGVPALTANVSNTIGLLPGSLSAVHGYRRELAGRRHTLVRLCVAGGLGGLTGGLLLLAFPSSTFEAVVPFLLVLAGILTALQPTVSRRLAEHPSASPHGGPLLLVLVGLTGVYGGYFGAAQGVILLALLGVFLESDVQRANAVKNLVALVVNVVAGILFALRADVDWGVAALLALGALAGGTTGVRVARRLPPAAFRWFVVLVAITAAVAISVKEVG